MPYTIALDPDVPVTADQSCYVVHMNDAYIINVTVTSDGGRILEWLDRFIAPYRGEIVSVHGEPRPFNCGLASRCLQPNISALFVAVGHRVLVLPVRRNQDLPALFVIDLFFNERLYFVGMHIDRLCDWLGKRVLFIKRFKDLRAFVMENTNYREDLSTPSLRKLVHKVTGVILNPSVSRRFCPCRWWMKNLSPELVMYGSIRAHMAFRVAQTALQTARLQRLQPAVAG
ncbi:hypothetical protein J5N97_007283 [Dioscorea zingiberensis]|uniref:Uncharacterized protein n=1 Tax=Dioscorea zingiberensis TaxID=325984 RepID=A0A9D5DFI9_9LILI|nr:hypothetical protein J5N97_007283 [Dioscorea zingiberensis]